MFASSLGHPVNNMCFYFAKTEIRLDLTNPTNSETRSMFLNTNKQNSYFWQFKIDLRGFTGPLKSAIMYVILTSWQIELGNETQQKHKCVQIRHRSAWASTQSDQSLLVSNS